MKKLLICSLFAGAVGFMVPGLMTTASAAPVAPSGIEIPGSAVEQVAMKRRHMRSRYGKRRTMSARAARQRGSINARNPALSPMQQNQGSTTGGPRY